MPLVAYKCKAPKCGTVTEPMGMPPHNCGQCGGESLVAVPAPTPEAPKKPAPKRSRRKKATPAVAVTAPTLTTTAENAEEDK